jgi:hypothetical protein
MGIIAVAGVSILSRWIPTAEIPNRGRRGDSLPLGLRVGCGLFLLLKQQLSSDAAESSATLP